MNRSDTITPFQLFSITLFSMMFGLHIYPSAINHEITHEWFIAQVITVILMFPVLFMILYIFDPQRYSSFEEALTNNLGKVTAKILSVFLLVYFILHSVSIISLESNNIQIFLFDKTPVSVIALVIVTAAFIISFSGLTPLARLSEILSVPVLISAIILLIICLSGSDAGEIDTLFQPQPKNIFSQVIKSISCFFCIELTSIFICRTGSRRAAKAALITGYSICSAVMLLLTLCIAGTFTLSAGAGLLYPVTELARTVQLNYLRIVERFDTFMITSGITITCVFVSIACYCASSCISLLFSSRKFRYSIPVYILLITVLLISSRLNLTESISAVLVYLETAMLFLIIPVIFIIALIKRKGEKT